MRKTHLIYERGGETLIFVGADGKLYAARMQFVHCVHESGISLTMAREIFRSEEHTSELQSLMRISYAVFCLKKKKNSNKTYHTASILYETYSKTYIVNVQQ